MDDQAITDMIERDPDAVAKAICREMGVSWEPEESEPDEQAPMPPPRVPFAWRAAGACGRGIRFLVYCVLCLMRPLVMLGGGALALIGGLGVLVLLFIYQADWTKVVVSGGIALGGVVVRELYDGLLVRVAPPSHAMFSD